MKIILFDLTNRNTLEKISQQLRTENAEVHDVTANVSELPNGAYGAIDQIWYQGEVLTKLADMFSANIFRDETEFIFDTSLTILNTSVTILKQETAVLCKLTDYRQLL